MNVEYKADCLQFAGTYVALGQASAESDKRAPVPAPIWLQSRYRDPTKGLDFET